VFPLQRRVSGPLPVVGARVTAARPPLMKLCDLSVCLPASRVVAYLVRHALLRPWSPRPVLGAFLDLPCHDALSSVVTIHSQASTLLQGVTGDSLRASFTVCTSELEARYRSWGSCPFSDRQLEGAVQPGKSSSRHACVFRVSTLLTPCSPSSLPDHF
jgi:hypothetical protein